MNLQPDTILDERYRIIEKLGQGGMGAVYLAWDQRLEIRVAVKVNFNPAPQGRGQFLKKAQLLAALHHPNLPRVTDYFIIENEQFLVMDYIPGDDLGLYLAREGAQKLEHVLFWASQLCHALHYMHHQVPPVTHRDIKPANIKLTPEGNVILVDFGIAKADQIQAQTSTGASGYTPGYAPPEQYGGARTGPFSDQFSLAATLYALLSGEKPADSIQRVLGKEELIPLHALNPRIPLNISDAILKALSLRSEQRFESVLNFHQALENPGFRLKDQDRQAIAAPISYKISEPSRLSDSPGQKKPDVDTKRKRRSRKLILGLLLGLGGVCILAAILMASLFPKSPIASLFGANTRQTEIINLQKTQEMLFIEASLAPQALAQSPVPFTETSESPTVVTPTTTLEPTTTETLDMVGGSGRIVFASDRGTDGYIQIWEMRVFQDAQDEIRPDAWTQLTFDGGDKDQPVWSPDGNRIAYVSPGGGINGLDIWVMNADGSNPVNITNYQGDEFDPEWAPDGSRIAFTHYVRDSNGAPIYALTWIKPDGSDRQRLSTDFVEYDPTFSPDMQWMLYVISANSHDFLYFRSAKDGFQKPRGFDPRTIFGEFGEVSDPSWAPVGKQIAYTRHDGATQNIVLVTYESMQDLGIFLPQAQVLTMNNSETDAAWSPDGGWLAFASSRDGGDLEIYLMPTTGEPQINLSARQGVDKSPNWFPLSAGN